MFLQLYVAATSRWRELTSKDETDRGDSPVPTVIMWIGIALVAVGLITWVGLYIAKIANSAPAAPTAPGIPAP
jgi:hypothetical protein